MTSALKYIVDSEGKKVSVLVPIKEWEAINADHKKQQNKINILTGIRNGLQEVADAKKKGKKLQTLNDFLNEGNR